MVDPQPNDHPTIPDLVGPFDGARLEAELFVRSLAPFPTRHTQERLIDRLDALRRSGPLDSLSIRVWGDVVRTDGAVARACDGDTVVDRVTEFLAHAADSACSLSRYFRVVTDGSTADDGGSRRIAPPQRCLSIRRDGELVAVFPCDFADERYKPEDAVAYLEGDRSVRPETRLARASGR